MINKVEWSGVLFFKEEGKLGTPTFKLTAEEVFLMDKGTSGYTEYETNQDLIDYMMENDYLLELKRSHIHSHHSMATFFSGTDSSELEDNSEFYNYYLSLIVNNNGEMCAKVAFRGKQKSPKEVFIMKNGEGQEVKLETSPKDEEVIFVYDCNIVLEVDNKFLTRVEAVIKSADLKQSTYAKAFNTGNKFQHSLLKDKDAPNFNSFNKNKKQRDYTRQEIRDFAADFVLLTSNCNFSLEQAFESLSKEITEEGEITVYLDSLFESYRAKVFDYFTLRTFETEAFEDISQELCDMFMEQGVKFVLAERIAQRLEEILIYLDTFEDELVNWKA